MVSLETQTNAHTSTWSRSNGYARPHHTNKIENIKYETYKYENNKSLHLGV